MRTPRTASADRKGVRPRLPERPFGCCAQTGSDPFFRSGFSLLELMIAIMILGIGVVMVATVFPVGIEMTREPIQAYLRLAIADSAVNVLKTKVPGYRNLDGVVEGTNYSEYIRKSTQLALVPNVDNIEINTPPPPANEPPCVINQQELDLFVAPTNLLPAILWPPAPPTPPISYTNWDQTGWTSLPAPPSGQTKADFISRTRVFTERTGWSAEVDIGNLLNHNGFNTTSPIPAQNLPADLVRRTTIFTGIPPNDLTTFFTNTPTMVNPSLAGRYQTDLPRISIVDQVYPPVTLTYPNGAYRLWDDTVYSGQTVTGILSELRGRQYSWAAFHHRMSSETALGTKPPASKDMLATIAILHRADIGARFARQESLDTATPEYKVDFDFNNVDHRNAMFQPQADPDLATDAIFPRPWLATIYRLNPQNGEAVVTPELARLLPAGSSFIIARHNGGSNGYYAGTFIQVTRNEWNPASAKLGISIDATSPATLANYTEWTRIEVARSSLPSAGNVAVWVFPPTITTLGPRDPIIDPSTGAPTYEFSTRSPIVGVEMRRIAVQ